MSKSRIQQSDSRSTAPGNALLSAQLVGCINPLEMEPSFLVPVFKLVDGGLVVQEAGLNDKIRNFYSYDQELLGKLTPLDSKAWAKQGDNVLYGFVFPNGECVVEPRRVLAKKLVKEHRNLARYRFLYMEVLEFLGQHADLLKKTQEVGKFYADRSLISRNWVTAQNKFFAQKKTSFAENYLMDAITGGRPSVRVQRVGIVSSDKMMKTVVVRVDRLVRHAKYRRYIRRSSKFMAHDEIGASIGDKVRIIETRPLSKKKRWRVAEIVRRASH
jgi:small subunit ribosomal protein S17